MVYSPEEKLVLISEGTPISISIAGIKHSMSHSNNSTYHSFEQDSILLPQVCDCDY